MVRRKGLGAGKGKGYKNILPTDKKVHAQSARGVKQPQRVSPYIIGYKHGKTKEQILSDLRENKNFVRDSHFYVGSIDLGSQGVMVNIPVKQEIEITKASNGVVVFKIKKMIPRQNLEYLYEQEFKGLIAANPAFKEKLSKMMQEQKNDFILNAEGRINSATSGENFRFDFATKRSLENFYADLHRVEK